MAQVQFEHNGKQFYTNFETLWQLKNQLEEDFCKRFFDRKTRRFHGDKKHYWSKSRQVLVITREFMGQVSTVEYEPVLINGKLELRCL